MNCTIFGHRLWESKISRWVREEREEMERRERAENLAKAIQHKNQAIATLEDQVREKCRSRYGSSYESWKIC